MKDLGATQSYLGIWITRDHTNWCIWIDQEAYIDSALTQFQLVNANNTKTLLPVGVHLTKSETPSTAKLETRYQQLISTLLYAALGTRPNIALQSHDYPDSTQIPQRNIWDMPSMYVLRYLKGTKSLWICYDGSLNAGLIGYSDSNWGKKKDDHHSTSASQHQKTVALSVGELEYMELASASHQCA